MIWEKIKGLMNNGFRIQTKSNKNVLVIRLTKNKNIISNNTKS